MLTYPLDNWSTWYGPIGPNPAATMMAAMQHIRRTPRDWDMIELRWVADENTQGGKIGPGDARGRHVQREAGISMDVARRLAGDVGRIPGQQIAVAAAAIPPDAPRLRSWTARTEYVRHRPLPASEGDGDPRWDLYAMCESVAQASWQSHVTNGNTLTHDRVREYFHATHEAAARVGNGRRQRADASTASRRRFCTAITTEAT